MIGDFLYRITEPALRPIRNMMPNLGGIDISPVILILIIIFIRYCIALYIRPTCSDLGALARPWTVTADCHRCSPCGSRPRAGATAIDGMEQLADGRSVLKVRVRAAASEGEAERGARQLDRRDARRCAARRELVAGATLAAQAA